MIVWFPCRGGIWLTGVEDTLVSEIGFVAFVTYVSG